MRILIVEDDAQASAYLVKAFREAGHMAEAAGDGVSGYARAEAGGFDVLVVDRMLPKMDGLTLIGGLRAQKIETPVLILSALGQVDDRVKGLRAGGDDYLPKPYSFAELLARLEILARRVPGAPRRRRSIASPISKWTGSSTRFFARARRSCCSRANSGCWNI